MTGFLRQLFQIELITVVVGILAILEHLDVITNGHSMTKHHVLCFRSIKELRNHNRYTQSQWEIIQLCIIGQTTYMLHCGSLLRAFQSVRQFLQYLFLHLWREVREHHGTFTFRSCIHALIEHDIRGIDSHSTVLFHLTCIFTQEFCLL